MSAKKSLTPREMELTVLAWRALEEPKVDFDKLAEIGRFKNANSARACFYPLRKKLLEGSYAAAATPASTKAKRTAAAATVPADEDGDDNPTPTKKPRGRPKKVAKAVPTPVKDEEVKDEEVKDEQFKEDDDVEEDSTA